MSDLPSNYNTQNVTAVFHHDMYVENDQDIGGWFVGLDGCPGVWGVGDALAVALDELPGVLQGWLEVGGAPTWPTVINTTFTAIGGTDE